MQSAVVFLNLNVFNLRGGSTKVKLYIYTRDFLQKVGACSLISSCIIPSLRDPQRFGDVNSLYIHILIRLVADKMCIIVHPCGFHLFHLVSELKIKVHYNIYFRTL